MNDPKLVDCLDASCGGRVRRLLGTGAGVIFKGSGFYQTDYRSPSYHEAAKAEKSASSDNAAKTETTKTDTAKPTPAKPATTTGDTPKPT